MEIPVTFEMPLVFDLLHLILASAVLLFLLMLLFMKRSTSTNTETKAAGADQPLAQPAAELGASDAQGALHLLSLLQREGRLLDFISESIDNYSDEEVGSAVRIVHKGLKGTIENYFEVQPLREEEEGAQLEIPSDFDRQSIQLVGNVSGEGPFSGKLVHQGWQVKETRLPQISVQKNHKILLPAQVEI